MKTTDHGRSPRDDEHRQACELAEYLELVAAGRDRITAEDLGKEGLGSPFEVMARPLLIAYLGARRLFVQPSEDGRSLLVDELTGSWPTAQRGPAGGFAGEGSFFWYPPQETALLRELLAARRPLIVVGPAGCGKTTLLELLSQEVLGEAPVVLSLCGETSAEDLYGTKELRGGATELRPGPALVAMLEGRPLILNEIDAVPAEILFSLHRLAEGKGLTLTSASDGQGRPLVVDPWSRADRTTSFALAATANTIGLGDDDGLYRGTHVLNEAFRDRFWIVRLTYPPPEHERRILLARTRVAPRHADRIVEVAKLARGASRNRQGLAAPFSVRCSLRWAEAVGDIGLSLGAGFRLAVLSHVAEEDAVILSELYQRVTGALPDANV